MIQKFLIKDSGIPIFHFKLPEDILDAGLTGALEIVSNNDSADDQNFDYVVANLNPFNDKITTNVDFLSKSKCHLSNENIKKVASFIEKKCTDASKTWYKLNIDFQVVNSSVLFFKRGNNITTHCHFPYIFVAVLYLDLEDYASPIILGDTYEFKPTKGDCLIFPGQCNHTVPKTNSKRLLITMDLKNI